MARLFVSASSQYLERTGVPVSATPLTMACWYRVTATADQTLMAISTAASANNRHSLVLSVAGNVVAATNASASTFAVTSVTYATFAWEHACAVFAGASSRSVYKNGANKVTGTGTQNPAGMDTFSVGRILAGSGVQYVSGQIAIPAIWSADLTDAEVARLAAGEDPRRVRPESLVFFAPLVSGREIEPDIRGGFDLTVNGPVASPDPPLLTLPAMDYRLFLGYASQSAPTGRPWAYRHLLQMQGH